MTADLIREICDRITACDDLHSDALSTDLLVLARQLSRELQPLATNDDIEAAAKAAIANIHGLGPLQPFLDDPLVNEIMVNNGGDVWLERDGCIVLAGRLSSDVTPRLIERVLRPLGRRLDLLSPIVDARLADGSRLCAVIPPIAVDGPCLSLRRFGIARRALDQFAHPGVVELLRALVDGRCNVVISGATSSGKTSLLNALVSCCQPTERIITLEDTAELQLDATHVLRLETRPATVEGVAAIEMHHLVRTALRLRPDRIVVGEIRGAEVIEMLQALNTGHSGSFATVHANSAEEAVRRIEALVVQHAPTWPLLAVRDYVLSNIDAVVHLSRNTQGVRRVLEIVELVPARNGGGLRQLVADGTAIAPLERVRT